MPVVTGGALVLTQTLQAIAAEVADDSSLLAVSLRRQPAAAGAGYSDLYTAAGGGDAEAYRFALEYIFEGYLLHYGESRLLEPQSSDLLLLAGDYMYARGLGRLAALEDTFCIMMLARLVELCSFIHCEGMDPRLALDAWSVVTLCLARRASGGCGGGFAGMFDSCFRSIREDGGEGASLATLRDDMLSELPEARRGEIGAILSRIYSGCHHDRRRDGH